ncbi:MAG TPA: PAS domain S-box protein [Rhodanobacteraceae bacterium]|nr:PAS domain S-box protein [Rhodanobacteraceae bacterium]
MATVKELPTDPSIDVASGPSPMRVLVAAHHWAATPLGAIASWPQSLRSAVELILPNRFPQVILWGPELLQIYNDGYAVIMADKHPAGLGQPNRECWPEVWHINKPIYDRVFEGETVNFEDALYPLTRHGRTADAWFDLCYSPMRDGAGKTAGVLVTLVEVTDRHHATTQRARAANALEQNGERQSMLLELGDVLRPLSNARAVRTQACEMLGRHLQVDRAYYADVDTAGHASFIDDYHSDGMVSMPEQYRLEEFGVAAAFALRAGNTLAVDDLDDWKALSDEERQHCHAHGMRALLKVPLVKEGRLTAFLALHQSRPRHWTNGEIALVEEIAQRTWAIIERAQAETALRLGEEKYRGLFESIDQGFCVMKAERAADGKIVDLWFREANPAFERESGIHNAVGRPISMVMPEYEGQWLDAIEGVMQSGEPVRMEDFKATTGRWYSVQFSRIGDEKAVLVAAVFNDVTEHKRIERAMSRLAAIVESSDDAIISKNLDGVIQTWNAAAERMFGYTAAEAIGKPVTMLMPPDRVSEEAGILARIRRGERINHDETVRKRKDGSLLDVSLTISPVKNPAGRVVAASKIARDITARKRMEAVLRESQQRQAFLLRLADAMRVTADPVAVQDIAMQMLGEYLNVGRAFYFRAEYDADRWVDVVEAEGYHQPGFPARTGRFAQSLDNAFIADLERGKTLVCADTRADGGCRCRLDICLAPDVCACVAAPIAKDGVYLGGVCVQSGEPRAWTRAEITLIEEVAERTWDTVERARAKAERQESEVKYRTLFDSVDEGFCVIELMYDEAGNAVDYTFVEANPVVEAQVGQGYLIGKRIREVAPQTEPFWLETYGRIALTGNAERFERRAVAVDRWYSVYAFAVGAPEQRRVAVLSQEITQRKGIEMAMRVREEQQSFLLKLSDALRAEAGERDIGNAGVRMLAEYLGADRCYITRMSYDENRARLSAEYRRSNLDSVYGGTGEVSMSQFPVAVQRLQAQPLVVNDITAASDLSDAERESIRALGGMAALIAVPLRAGEQNSVWALAVGCAEPRQWSPNEVNLLEDVAERIWGATERALVEDALRENQARLQNASRVKDEFLAMLGHELRNPLAPITTTVQLMKLRAPDTFVRERDIIEAQVRYLTGLVDDLLDVSRIASGKIELKTAEVDLGEVVAAAIETTQTVMEERSHSLHVEVDGQLVVSGDRRRLVQILVNLLGNAAKYSPPGRNVWLSASVEDGQAVLRVRDEGQGIDADLLPFVFELFSQGRQAIDRSHGGLGLGLSIVRNLVTLHGGAVEVASAGAYKGSEFTVRLPLLEQPHSREAAPTRTETPKPAGATRDDRRIKVLVVDDYVLAAESLSLLLQEMGYRTHVVHDGAAALQAMKTFEPQVALVDIGLPVIDGYEVAQTVRRMPGRESLPLIAVTGYGQPGDRARVMAAGFDEHLVKPLDASRISELIERMVTAS